MDKPYGIALITMNITFIPLVKLKKGDLWLININFEQKTDIVE